MGSCASISGGVVSETTTLKVVGMAELPYVSVALQVTVVEPSPKVEPDAGVQVAMPSPSTASCVAGAVYVATAPALLVASNGPSSPCGSMVGAVVSITLRTKLCDVAALSCA